MEQAKISQELELARKNKFNLLMPTATIEGLSEFHAPVLEHVTVSADPNDGDVYPHDDADDGPKKKFRLTKQSLMRLSVCAGVIWSPDQSRRIDTGSDRNYIAYRAVGGLRKADGQPVFFSAEYDIDFEVLEEELRELYTRKSEAKDKQGNYWKKTKEEREEYVEYCVKRDMLQKRKFKLRLCEAGAMNRVLRMLLGIKQAYTKEELSKPFVMARIVFRPDFSDASVRQQFIDASIRAMTGVYGPGAAAAMPKEAEAINVTPCPPDEPEEKPEAANGKSESSQQPPPSESETEFQKLDLTKKIAAIEKLAKAVSYDLPDYVKRSKAKTLADLGDGTMANLYKHLLSKQPKKDDTPF